MKTDFHTLIGRIQNNTPEATVELPRVEIRLQRRRRGVRETTCLRPLVAADAVADALTAIAGVLAQYPLRTQLRRTMLELRGDHRETVSVALILAGWLVCLTDDSLAPQRR